MNHQFSRRDVLKVVAASAATVAIPSIASPQRGAFPRGFLWGAATAGHQVEGNNVNADMWVLEQVKPTLFAEPSLDACDSFSRWREDLDLVRALGLNTFRFSLEWARIEPAQGEFSLAMLDHYKRIIGGCRERGLTPMVTFNHFTTPRWFAAAGGWEVTGAADLFARYCTRAARYLGDELTFATTLNEPNILQLLKWLTLPFPAGFDQTQTAMLQAAAKASGSDKFSVANFGEANPKLRQLVDGHIKGYQAIKGACRNVQVGVSLSITDDQAVGANSKLVEKRRDAYGAWLQVATACADFIGVQNYGRQQLDANGPVAPPKGAELTTAGDEFYPASLEGAVRYVYAATGKPIIVTENGINTTDDSQRARYIPLALAGLQRAIADGVPVGGYIHWSLMDNFEWFFGYTPKYGLVAVDRQSFARTIKPSAQALSSIARRNAL